MPDVNIERVNEDDPMRCQAVTNKGQCLNKAVIQGGNCLVHGGNKQLESKAKESIRNYRLAKFQTELNRHATSPKLKSLNDEVAILRMLLEEQLNQCNDMYDLTLKSHIISDLVVKIEKLVKSCHNLEASLGGLMDKTSLLAFATKVIEVISGQVDDEEILTKISDGIIATVKESNDSDS